MKRFFEEAKKIIRINSVTANGNEEIANYVATLMQDRGLKTQLQHVTHSDEDLSKRQFNVVGILGDPLVDRKIRKGLLLNTHLDTVSPGLYENWTEADGNPFVANFKDNKIYGLGSADVKLDFLCKLFAIEKFRERKLKEPIYLVGTCGEEVGMIGAKYLIKSMALNPKFVLVGEPSELKAIYAHKCLNIFKLSIGFSLMERDAQGFNRRIDLYSLGKSAHSSYPHLGVNAISEALSFLHAAMDQGFEMRFTRFDGGDTVNKVPDRANVQFYLTSHQLEDFKRFFREFSQLESKKGIFRCEFGGVGEVGVSFLPEQVFSCMAEVSEFFKNITARFQQHLDSTYDPPCSTVNMGKLKQKTGAIDMYFDFRLLPDVDPEKIQTEIKEGIHSIAQRYPNMNISAVRERFNPGLNMSIEDPLLQMCKSAMEAAKIQPAFAKKATSTEAALYFQSGYPAIVFGPGKSQGNSHSPNEHNLIDQLESAIEFYSSVIERFCCL